MADDKLRTKSPRLGVDGVEEDAALGVNGFEYPAAFSHDRDLVEVGALWYDGDVRLVDAEGKADANDQL